MKIITVFGLSFILALGACTKKTSSGSGLATLEPVMTAEELQSRGKAIYTMSCLSCHNADPSKDGSVGPAIQGSSLELLTARIMLAKYPEGYAPKRPTGQMPAMPHLEKELPALRAYLN